MTSVCLLVQVTRKAKKDFYEMLFHHVVTFTCVTTSFEPSLLVQFAVSFSYHRAVPFLCVLEMPGTFSPKYLKHFLLLPLLLLLFPPHTSCAAPNFDACNSASGQADSPH